MKYQVLEAESVTELQEMVEKEMRKGFQPIGGVAVHAIRSYLRFLQAMAKTDKKQIEPFV